MTAKLLVREVGQREFVQHNGEFDNQTLNAAGAVIPMGTQAAGPFTYLSGVEAATAEGERLCAEGNVEAFQVWTLVAAKQRVYRVEDIA